jgi:hypothetical protein
MAGGDIGMDIHFLYLEYTSQLMRYIHIKLVL